MSLRFQDNRIGGSPEKNWTANDLNTVARGSSHHPDLQDGQLGDQKLHLVFNNDGIVRLLLMLLCLSSFRLTSIVVTAPVVAMISLLRWNWKLSPLLS